MHQVSHDPQREHGEAVMQIDRYLKGTLDKGIITKPDDSHSLHLHATLTLQAIGTKRLPQSIQPRLSPVMATSTDTVGYPSYGHISGAINHCMVHNQH